MDATRSESDFDIDAEDLIPGTWTAAAALVVPIVGLQHCENRGGTDNHWDTKKRCQTGYKHMSK